MEFRWPLPIALALTLVPPVAGAQTFRYAPGTARYKASVVTQMSHFFTDGERMDDELTQSQHLTVDLRSAAGDTLRIGVRLDSAAIATRAYGPDDVSPLIGLRIDGRISPNGRLYSSAVASRDIGPTGVLIGRELANFLPHLRSDLRTGLAWTDTTAESVDMFGVPVHRRVITTSRVRGDTTVAGARGWKIDRRSVVSFAGTGTLSGQQIKLTGSSTAAGIVVVSRAGRYLASEQTDSVTTKFTVPARGMEIGMTQSQVTRVAMVP